MPKLFILQDIADYNQEKIHMNRYFFDYPGTEDITAEDVANEFANQWLNVIRGSQSQEVDHELIYCKNLLDTTDDFLLTLSGAIGFRGGDALPSFNTISMYMRTAGPTIRRGGKRYCGIWEDGTDSNNPTGGAGSVIDTLEDMLSGTLLIGAEVLTHAVVRAIGSPVVSYVVSPVIAAAFRRISTQRSRLAGGANLTLPFTTNNGSLTANTLTLYTDQDFADEANNIRTQGGVNQGRVEKTYTLT